MAEKWSGKLKEAEGKLTDDKVREGQGKAEATIGEAKDKVEDVGTSAERKLDDLRDEDDV